MKKLEETFNLPPMDEALDVYNDDRLATTHDMATEWSEDATYKDVDVIKNALTEADQIDRALTPVKGLEELDADMDKYADRAMLAFEDLMDLGQNVEDRHSAPIFDTAARMMGNALQAKQAKMDKKLKVVQMQMQKQKLELEKQKLELQMMKAKGESDPNTIESTGEVLVDRTALINDIMSELKNK